MGIMNLSLRRGKLGLCGVYPHHSGTGSLVSFLCLGMTLRPLLARLGVTSQGYSVGGEPFT